MQASITAYIHIYGPYKPNKSFEYIYLDAIYMFSAFIWMVICIISFAYMCLCMLQAVVLHHFKIRVSMLKKAPKTKLG